jgi:rhamnosyltransferase
MSKNSNNKYISVFIPTFNGDQYLAECIEAILGQKLPDGYELELLIIDSGSSDKTLEIIEAYKSKLKLVQIANADFSHGGTRQRAAEMAKGEFILFLSQDATPYSDRWLINMVEPFYLNQQIGCVFGRQIPRPNAAPTIKREVAGVFGEFGAPDIISINRIKSLVDHQTVSSINGFFSDVNSAARRHLLVGPVPFRNVNYAEDQALAEDMLKHGYFKAYAPLASVWHSNEYTAKQYFHRKFDEYIGLQESVRLNLLPSRRSLLLGWMKPTIADWKFIVRDQEYTLKSKIVWFIETPFYNIAEKAGRYLALKNISNSNVRKRMSLEHKNRS